MKSNTVTQNSTLSWLSLGMLALGLLLLAALGAWLVHVGCHEASPAFDVPLKGTPRAGYCSAVESVNPWMWLVALPPLLFLALGSLVRRWGWAVWALAGMVALVIAANATLANALTFSYSIP